MSTADYCVWLRFRDADVSARRGSLVQTHSLPRFDLHVTFLNQRELANGIAKFGSLEALLAAASRLLAPKRFALALEPGLEAVPESYFMSCFLKVRDGPDLRALREIKRELGGDADAWLPHVSLLYVSPTARARAAAWRPAAEALARELSAAPRALSEIVVEDCPLDRIEAWRAVHTIADYESGSPARGL